MTRAWGLVVVAAVACYLPHVLAGQFVYEDLALMSSVAVGPPSLWHPRGLSRVLWWWQWQVSPHPVLFHAVSVGLHLTVAGLTGLLVRRLGLSRAASSLALAVMALHPLTVEAVAYAAQQGELLAAIGVLTACVLATGRWWRAPVWIGIVAGIAFGMLGKESAVVALVLVPLLIVARARQRPGAWLPAVVAGWLVVAGVAWYGGPQALVNQGEAPGVHVAAVDWLLVQSAAAMRTLGLLVLPIGPFTVDYDYDAVPRVMQMLAVVGLVCVGLLAWWLRRRWPDGALGLAWMLLVIAPRLVVQTPRSIFNDHQAYLMVPGFALLVGAAWDRWGDKAGYVDSEGATALLGRSVSDAHSRSLLRDVRAGAPAADAAGV